MCLKSYNQNARSINKHSAFAALKTKLPLEFSVNLLRAEGEDDHSVCKIWQYIFGYKVSAPSVSADSLYFGARALPNVNVCN